MTEAIPSSIKCIIGQIESMPNKLDYEQTISSRNIGVWIGYCKGDSVHPQHFLRIIKISKFSLLKNKTDTFKIPKKKSTAKRLFPFKSNLRCPTGKVYMTFQKKLTQKLGKEGIDIYRCHGNRKGTGHKEHYVRIEQGLIANGNIGMITVSIESS